ncbi:sensor histidine kinase [Alicycliphilus denitrificans]|uniref:sensor histidine kinase n=1 Tax=Alicycliphilus denitrificans TaxID=179636 RepID=UPI00384BA02B
MSWNWTGPSTRQRLLALLLPAMTLMAAAGLWFTREDAIASTNAAYDRSLLGAIKSLDLNVSTASGGLSVELPYRLFEFFQLTAKGSVYFRVATADGLVELGNPDLPAPPSALRPGQPVFYDARYFGENVRVGAFMRALDAAPEGSDSQYLVIQVAEGTASRAQFTAGFVRRAALRDLLLLAVLLASVVAVLGVALRPITRLAAQTRARAPDDLRPIETDGLPRDIEPLVAAVNQQMERTRQLMDERQSFVDDASHQLHTPLATLRAQLDYALREPDAARQRLALQALSAALADAIRATNQLLALARSNTAQALVEPVDLAQLARDVAVELLPLARTHGVDLGVDLGVEGDASEAWASGDRELLRQALLNITHNAIEHGREHGVVTLTAGADTQGWHLRVVDDGPGMPPELAGRAGERFAKGRKSRGSGLGLAIARSAIGRHGGALRLEPAPGGQGACVTLWWPRA